MYLVTGASGNIGSRVLAELQNLGKQVRVLTSDPNKATKFESKVEVVVGGLGQPDVLKTALAGVSHLFLMNRGLTDESLGDLLDIAHGNQCKRMVFLSSIAAKLPELTLGKLHLQQEQRILASSIQARILRATAFMSNALQWAQSIKTQGVVYNPMGDGSFAPIAPEDIATFAVHLLIDDGNHEEISSITGPELLTVSKQIATLSQILGVPIQRVDVTDEQAVEQIMRGGFPRPLAAAVVELYAAVRTGSSTDLLHTFERVMGYRPRTFATWARENKQRFV
ncbi:NAD-dependent epimerase/dehydratase family protein [Terriglobus albidus]|uniref:NAD-dependent epimerase/dehydratase family protein n=1 Tax=Terriglobus albidus TaxID=1592106 RepID=A0A5B9EAU3_9BACT|nr:NAD(P)H-binding protein [Terriglobus albidus]QEE28794.1 NAD-dependent epimerase/dehydratase family protein [Terriglobus albidus]